MTDDLKRRVEELFPSDYSDDNWKEKGGTWTYSSPSVTKEIERFAKDNTAGSTTDDPLFILKREGNRHGLDVDFADSGFRFKPRS